MNPASGAIARHALVLNRGSSSLRIAMFLLDPVPTRVWTGSIERLGTPRATAVWILPPAGPLPDLGLAPSASDALLDWLPQCPEFQTITAIGHRIVHGMDHSLPEQISAELLADLQATLPLDPEHAPSGLDLLGSIQSRFPELVQCACFDTAFHQTLPRVARILAIPRRFESQGVRRYGFHGLSYHSILDALRQQGDPAATSGRLILAHLGSGCSMAAVRDGQSADTTMGFTPAGGLPMGSRSGDLDPGVTTYLLQQTGMTAAELGRLVNHDSGLLGISEISSDMRDLLAHESADPRAGEAIAVFCYAAKKQIGAYAAALGGVDGLVFTGGIGEHCASIRSRICDGLQFLGIDLDPTRNDSNAEIISSDTSRVTVRVLRTDEELVIAQAVRTLLATIPGIPSRTRPAATFHSE